jgi:hypothetical protein
MPSGMYSTIHLLEIMRRSAFKSPLLGQGTLYVLMKESVVCKHRKEISLYSMTDTTFFHYWKIITPLFTGK